MSLIMRKNMEVTTIRQILPKQCKLDSFCKPISHVTFTILLGI